MTGRPSSYTPEMAKTICDRLSIGRSLSSICKDEDMPCMATVMSWLVKSEQGNPEFVGFLDSYLRAREAQADVIFDECLEIADDSGADTRLNEHHQIVIDGEVIQRAKLRIDTRMRMAGKLKPKKYGDKIGVGQADGLEPMKQEVSLMVEFVNANNPTT